MTTFVATPISLKELTKQNHLYGREAAIASLMASFDRISSGSGELILIPGYSGVGKTALVQEIRKPIRDRNGFFLQGKFNQYQQNIPYFAIRQALSELARELLSENESLRQQWQTTLQQAVGVLGQILVDLVPEFAELLGSQPAVAEISPLEARHRFATVLRNFFAAVCQPEHPVVLFIDDWQWADTASFELLKQFQIGTALRYLLVIAPYRDNEVDGFHPLISTVEELRRQIIPVSVIDIRNLEVADVLTWIKDLLQPKVENPEGLAKLIHKRTKGNPFFTQCSFTFLYEFGLLHFDQSRNCWFWKRAETTGMSGLPNDVVELFRLRLFRLDQESRDLLSQAACLGNHFDLDSLTVISRQKHAECRSRLLAIPEMVVPINSDNRSIQPSRNAPPERFMFVHDRVQQAAYGLIQLENLPSVHLEIGRLLLARLSPQQLTEYLFEVVGHLNVGQSLITDTIEQTQVVKLNIAAAQKARRATAYQATLQFHRAAGSFLAAPAFAEHFWNNHHDLAMALFQEWAESEFLEGDRTKPAYCIGQAVAHARTPTEKAGALNTLIIQNTLLARYPEAIAVGRQALAALGITLPEEGYETACVTEIDLVRRSLAGRTVASLADLPIMSHLEMCMAAKILITMGPPCYRSHQRLWSVIVPKVVNLTLQYGNVEQVSYSHPAFAGLLCWVANDFVLAKEFGELATYLMRDVFHSPTERSVYFLMTGSSVRHWFQPLKKGSEDYAEACEIGLQSGNLQYTAYALGHNMYCRFYQGVALGDLIKESQCSLAFSRTRFNQWAIDLLEGGLRIFSFLSDDDGEDESLQEADYLGAVETHGNIQVTCIYKIMKTVSFLFLGRYNDALEMSNQVAPILYTVGTQGLLPWAEHLFTRLLILTARFPNENEAQQVERRVEIVTIVASLRLWATHCPENFEYQYKLAAAEVARLDNQHVEAMELYEQAIEGAKSGGVIQWEGMAYERAAHFWQERGNDQLTNVYWQQAYSCFERWGAKTKLRVMENEYRQWLAMKLHQALDISDLSANTILEKQIQLLRNQAFQSAKALMQTELERQAVELTRATEHLRTEVAERKRIETELLLARDAAEAANKTKSRFLANMSHELRTPLNAILGFSRLMRADASISQDQVEDLDIIVQSGERLLELINNVLDISKIEAGRVELQESSSDLHHLLHEIQSLLNVRAIEKGLSFNIDLPPTLPRYVVVDAGKLRQVLINLVGNAIKFTRQGGVTLSAKATGQETKQSVWLRFAVEDTGSGISEENCRRIFMPFVQVVGQHPPVEAGTGLGLAISRQFVELMQGVLEVSSVLDKGSVFHFEIPVTLSTAPNNTTFIDQQRGRKVIGLVPGQPCYRLLVAEDHPENRLLLHKLLKPLGFEIRDALNGQEAVDQFEVWQPDLIWMDIRMPVMNGLEATRLIRASEKGSQVRIVALTAHALEEERLEILAAGCDDFVRKPYRESEIFDALTKHLGIRFLYAEQPDDTNEPLSNEVNARSLCQLPQTLLSELRQAVELLNQDSCIEIAGLISDIDYALGIEIRHQVENFQYKELLEKLDALIGAQSS